MLAERHSSHPRAPTGSGAATAAAGGLPQLGEMPVGFRLPSADDAQETPYRLPRLAAATGADELVDLNGGIYSRYGYTHRNPYENLGEKGESQFQWKYPLPTKSFRIYAGPTFRQATVAPSSTPRLVLPGARVPQVSRLLGRSQTTLGVSNNARPTPILRSAALGSSSHEVQHPMLHQQQQLAVDGQIRRYDAGSASEDDGLRWVLNPQRHFQVDRKGQQRNQGPFSREFTVHAMAPSNWLRMKWGRRHHQHQQQLLADSYRAVAVPAYYRQATSTASVSGGQVYHRHYTGH